VMGGSDRRPAAAHPRFDQATGHPKKFPPAGRPAFASRNKFPRLSRPPLRFGLQGAGRFATGLLIAIRNAMDASLKLKTDGEFKMATIGTFSLAKDGFLQGAIKTLTLDTQATFEPVESESKGAPSFRLYAGDIELGAAWPKTARESGREYHQVRIDDPSLPKPIFANLVVNRDGGFDLLWNRPRSTAKRSRH